MAQLPTTPIRDLADLARFEAELTLDERLPERSVFDVFVAAAARDPPHSALSQRMTGAPDKLPRRVSYAGLLGFVRQAANLFHSLAGPRPGVAYRLPSRARTSGPRPWPCAHSCRG